MDGNLWMQPSATPGQSVGVAALLSRGQYPYAYWYWIGIGALVGFAVIFNLGFTVALGFMPRKCPLLHNPPQIMNQMMIMRSRVILSSELRSKFLFLPISL
jgi:hypothetical protein